MSTNNPCLRKYKENIISHHVINVVYISMEYSIILYKYVYGMLYKQVVSSEKEPITRWTANSPQPLYNTDVGVQSRNHVS